MRFKHLDSRIQLSTHQTSYLENFTIQRHTKRIIWRISQYKGNNFQTLTPFIFFLSRIQINSGLGWWMENDQTCSYYWNKKFRAASSMQLQGCKCQWGGEWSQNTKGRDNANGPLSSTHNLPRSAFGCAFPICVSSFAVVCNFWPGEPLRGHRSARCCVAPKNNMCLDRSLCCPRGFVV